MKEVYVIKKGSSLYYVSADGWKPRFSANLEDALHYSTYEEALENLTAFTKLNDWDCAWFDDGFYQIEKWFVLVVR